MVHIDFSNALGSVPLIRTILDMMGTTDGELLAIMSEFEAEKASRYNCDIVERKEDCGGFLRWDGNLPDL
jgi:hypothetical protein